jgi:hypothetical protein
MSLSDLQGARGVQYLGTAIEHPLYTKVDTCFRSPTQAPPPAGFCVRNFYMHFSLAILAVLTAIFTGFLYWLGLDKFFFGIPVV